MEELFNLDEVVLFGEFDRLVPLVEEHTAVNSPLNIAKFDVGGDGSIAETHTLKPISKALENRALWRQHFNQLFHRREIL